MVADALQSAAFRARQGNLGAVLANRIRQRRGHPRRLLPHAGAIAGRAASRRLNRLLTELPDASQYLEIGVASGLTLDTICAAHRTAVEPSPLFDTRHLPPGVLLFQGTSDDFFASLEPEATYDVVFVDGHHVYEQAYRDVMNSFRHLSDVVLMDDVVPADEVSAMRDWSASAQLRAQRGLPGGLWHGDVFRALAVLRDHHPNLEFRVIVGSGNEQAVVWNREPSERPQAVAVDVLEGYGTLGYEDVFGDGVPAWFRPGDEESVMAEVVTAFAR